MPVSPARAKFIRKASHLTKGDFSSHSGIPVQEITDWEDGKIEVSPRIQELRSILEDTLSPFGSVKKP
jgi:DNA-binding transcriptional regulator YiaG